MQGKKRYLPGLLILAVTISTLLVALAVHSADAAVPPALQPAAPQAITPLPTTACHIDWQVVPSPNVGSQHNYLTDIDALDVNNVWAVGYYTGTGRYHTLIQRWDGQAWYIVPSPDAGYYNFLNAVEVIAPNDVWAVGSFTTDAASSGRHLLTMHWNGSQWSVVPNPDPGGNYTNFLTGVAAVASNDVWAVGFWRRNSPQGLILHWNGSQWLQAGNPTTGTVDAMSDVAVVSETDVWAVGSTSPNSTLIWRWNGASWVTVPSPDVGPLFAVDAVSQYDVWAVGDNSVLRWDGSQWNTAAPPGIGALYGVAALAWNDVWVVGTGLAHWNGTRWTTVPNPSTGTLNGISALNAYDIWAAGSFSDAGIEKTLIERYSYRCETKTCFTVQGAITNADPVQPGMLNRSLTPSPPCTTNSMPCPGMADTTPRHYKAYNYFFPYSSFSTQCITVQLDAPDCAGNLYSAAYWGLYDPNGICSINLRGALGDFSSGSGSYQFTAWRGNPFSIVVHEVNPNSGCSDYALTVATTLSCDYIVPITTTPTPTNTPNLPTATATRTPTPPTITVTVTPFPTWPSQGCFTLQDSITNADPVQPGMLESSFTPSPCNFDGLPCPGIVDNEPRHYKRYSYYFPYGSFSTQCITVRIDATGCPGNLFSAAYLSGFEGSEDGNICTALRGATGDVVLDSASYRFVVYRGYDFSIVVHEVGPNTGCSSYLLTVSSDTSCGNITTRTPTPAPTSTPTFATQTPLPTASATAICSLQMADVLPSNTFYPYVRCLTCKGIIGGYPCGGQGEPCNSTNDPYFRPNNHITRGQIAKIVSEAAGFTEEPGPQAYEDVPEGSPFYAYINRLSNRGLVGGYPCGQVPDEPCIGPGNRPYFRPNTGATRGQLAKIVATAASINDPVSGQFYADVPPTNPFYVWIERLTACGAMGGYPCGTRPSEPCDDQDRPYFRWAADITRGQASKIVTNTFFPGCQVLDR